MSDVIGNRIDFKCKRSLSLLKTETKSQQYFSIYPLFTVGCKGIHLGCNLKLYL